MHNELPTTTWILFSVALLLFTVCALCCVLMAIKNLFTSRLNKKTWLLCPFCKVKWLPPEPFIKADYSCPKCYKPDAQPIIDFYNKYQFTPYTREVE